MQGARLSIRPLSRRGQLKEKLLSVTDSTWWSKDSQTLDAKLKQNKQAKEKKTLKKDNARRQAKQTPTMTRRGQLKEKALDTEKLERLGDPPMDQFDASSRKWFPDKNRDCCRIVADRDPSTDKRQLLSYNKKKLEEKVLKEARSKRNQKSAGTKMHIKDSIRIAITILLLACSLFLLPLFPWSDGQTNQRQPTGIYR